MIVSGDEDGTPVTAARTSTAIARVPRTRPATGRRGAVVAGALLLAGSSLLAACAGPQESGPPASRLTSWLSTAGGGAAIETLEVDSRNIDLALTRKDPPAAIKTVCALLTNDAQTAIGNLPTPDTQLTDELNTAYEDAASAGDACYQGAGGQRSQLATSATERDKLLPLLDRAKERIVAITGHPPSTSTTQPAAPVDPFGN